MEDNKKNARIFYLTLAIILAVVTVLIIATAVAKRTYVNPNETTITDDSTDDKQTVNENDLPIFILPTSNSTISYDFSDTIQVFSPTMGDLRTHCGIDIEGKIGDEVFAVADGIVTDIKDDYAMGTSIVIEHEGNAVSIYRNLAPDVKEGLVIGSSVKSGDVIGYVGETAKNEIAQEPHLHYEMKIDGKHVDPKAHLPFSKGNDASSNENKTEESSDKE